VTGRVLMAALHLLDHQLVDRDGVLVGKVDDLELFVAPDGGATLTAVLSGPGVLATRLGHTTYGRWRERMETALEGPEGRTSRIAMPDVRRVTSRVETSLPAPLLASFGTERWVGDHLIGRIPGGRRTPDGGPEPGESGTAPEQGSAAPTSGPGGSTGVSDSGRVRVSAVLRREVVDGSGVHLGHVLDLRMVQDGPVGAGFDAAVRVDGVVVGVGRAPQRAGLLRHRVHGPWLLRQLAKLATPHRRYVPWADVRVATVLEGDGPMVVDGELVDIPGE
jgi:sporulation protein YlmC with PRC-barrel domain